VDKLVKEFKQKNPEFSLWLEPGRFPIAEAGKCNPPPRRTVDDSESIPGVLLCTVTQLKSKGSYNYIGGPSLLDTTDPCCTRWLTCT